ncbi:MAG: chemotaxis protein CheA [bacterium]
MDDLIKKIEDLSIALVMADLSDLQALADLYKRFEEISSLSQGITSKASLAAAKLIEKVILDEVSDKALTFDIISRTLSAIQSIVTYGRNENEIVFPKELGISIVEDSSKELPNAEEENIDKSEQSDHKDSLDTTEDSITQETEVISDKMEPVPLVGDPSLIADFISESREHLHEADVQLLTLESDPKNVDALNAVYRSFHTIKGVAGFLNLQAISTLSHATEDLLDHARKGEITLAGPAIDVTFTAVDSLKQMISDVEDALSKSTHLVHSISLDNLLSAIQSAISVETEIPEKPIVNNLTSEESKNQKLEIISNQEEIVQLEDKVLQEKSGIDSNLEIPSLQKESQIGNKTIKSSAGVVKETIKIEAERLDRLVDMIGELVIAESMVSQDSEILERVSARASRNLAHLNKITRELQEIGMSLRMMPVKPVFERMARLCRDLAKKAGKKIDFTMSGEDTEVDKSVVEKISDPLTHMIRNAVDHGIESLPEERVKLGKPEIGHIELRAFHKGGDIIIEVGDDGRGLDKAAILNKARERKIIAEDQILTDQDIYNLIFMPGFSTAKMVTDVSGRGVGMDVVNRNIQALRGQVEIRTVPGKGTTFVMRMPLTLAIMDGIIVKVGSEQYIIPTLSVVESIRPKQSDVSTVMGNAEMISVRGKLIPMFRISRLFGLNDAVKDVTEALVVIVEDEGKQVGFVVDNLVGHQQIVIKSLGDSFTNLKGISGGAIMADGRVGLILDVAGITKLAINEISSDIAA